MVPEDLAAQFRERHGKVGSGGVVIVYDGEAGSWVNKLRNPEHWRIGAVAVDEQGCKWVAVGSGHGLDDTASEWQLVKEV